MRNETSANLWFLVIFLALSVPGGVILFCKKLYSTARPMSAPDVVERRLPYMEPGPTPIGYTRDIPPATWAFLSRVASQQQAGNGQVLASTGQHGERLPIISDDGQLQLAAARQVGTTLRVDFVEWNAQAADASADPADHHVQLRTGSHSIPGKIVETKLIAVDPSTKEALMNAGAVKPSAHVLWIKAEFMLPPGMSTASGATLVLQRGPRHDNVEETLPIPSSATR